MCCFFCGWCCSSVVRIFYECVVVDVWSDCVLLVVGDFVWYCVGFCVRYGDCFGGFEWCW